MSRRLLNGMIAGQVALALLLLLSAGVMIRSFSRLLQVEPGFRTEDVMVATMSLGQNEFRDRDSQVQFWNGLVERVSALPGVEAVGAVSTLPMSPHGADFDLPSVFSAARPPVLRSSRGRNTAPRCPDTSTPWG
jgi:hypothetical protein